MKIELRESSHKITELEKAIAHKPTKKERIEIHSERSMSTPMGTKPRSISVSRKQSSRGTRKKKEESISTESDESYSDDGGESSDSQSSNYEKNFPLPKKHNLGRKRAMKYFLNRFTKIARQIQGLKHEVALNYLTDNLRDGPFCQSITKKPPVSMEELTDRSVKYTAIEEVEASKAASVAKKDKAEHHKRKSSLEERPKEERKRRDRRDRYKRLFQPRFELYSSLNRTPGCIMEDVYVANQLKFPTEKPIPSGADKSKDCEFHKTFGHETDNCTTLKDQIEDLVRKGHLRQYLDHNRYGCSSDWDNSRRDQSDRDKRRDDPPRDNHHRHIAGTINVIAEGIT
ncbi:uncharacterized protein G2W53_004428 [Senna tora]|uniref:Uncharacterized protein n=1 Tax=Senna tora TaxID=362788 RepID=A0A835CJC3_9FABA|nr:uncharacterized protein G2W53_004428 [Senna tora]